VHRDGCVGLADALEVRLRGFFYARGCVIYKGAGCSFMQARPTPRIRCSSVWVYLLFYFLFTFSLLHSFSFAQLPTLFPPGKGPFRFARPPSNLHRYPSTSSSSPSTALDESFLFSSRLLMWACLKRERLRWGSPTATALFALFWFCTHGLGQPRAGFYSCSSFREIPCPSVANLAWSKNN